MTRTTLETIDEGQQPMAAPGTGQAGIGIPARRVDGLAKVTGRARYAAEHPSEDLLYGVVVNSTIARGRILSMDTGRALAVPGVVDVLTHENRPAHRALDRYYKDMVAPAGSPFKPLHRDEIECSGQPIALVVAESFEVARYAASLVQVRYDVWEHGTSLLEHLDERHPPNPEKTGYTPPPPPKGDADAAYAQAPVKTETVCYSGVEHHNPMEMHASTVWRDARGHLLIHDKSQGSQNCRDTLMNVFGLPERKITVRNPFVGGAFGSGLRPQYQLFLAVMAALKLERSVRVVLTRQQMFTFGHRPETWQRVRLAAERDGRLRALIHEAVTETSRREDYVEVVVNWSGQLYNADNVRLEHQLVDLDVYTPIDMRAPGAAHGVHAIEVAMDELSYALGMDPLTLRLVNYAEKDGNTGLPFSSKELRACYDRAAERFGWHRRLPAPRAMRQGNELVGWGMATGTWDAMQMQARASATFHADGRLEVTCAASDIGTGTYTAISQIAAEAMGLPLEQVIFRLGDSDLPKAPIEGGSSHVATVGSAVDGACERLRRLIWRLAREIRGGGMEGTSFNEVEFRDGTIRLRDDPARALPLPGVLRARRKDKLAVRYLSEPNQKAQSAHTCAVHSAVFCEVRVDEALGTVRVARVVSAIAAGRIINPMTARSQIVGGIVWGIGQALHEETLTDHRLGRFMNHNLSEYHVPTNADVHDIDVIFVEEDDRIVSRMGAKGVGEIGIVGVSAAISNAIYHATGKRLRSLPMTPDKVMAS